MGPAVLILLAVAHSTTQLPDTSTTFDSPATRSLIERAMIRHRAGDSAVSDYAARARYRLTVAFGRRRWARVPTAAVEEQDALVRWQRPNDLRVDVLGRRARSRNPDLDLSSVFDRPWFVPRTVDDSVRIFSDEFPATGALHPLSAAGPDWYRYRRAGAVTVTARDGTALHLIQVAVTPARVGPALIAGHLWVDSATAEVVRLNFRYVGTGLWARPGMEGRDSSSARRINSIVNRILSIEADLEYALEEGRYWMPYRQIVSGRAQIPLIADLVIPFEAVTTFDDYAINTGEPVVFEVPLPDSAPTEAARRARRDSLRAQRRGELPDSLRPWDYAGRWSGGRFELHRPSDDSLGRYTGWTDSLELSQDPADERRIREARSELATLTEDLPDELTGERRSGLGFERIGDAFRYDRVQGVSLGLGYQLSIPGTHFTTAYATARYGFSDGRVMGRLSVVRDAPGGRFAASGYRDLGDVDPFALGRSVGNTLNALFVAHDDGDYYLAEGGSLGYETSLAPGLDLTVTGRVERQSSVRRAATSELNDWLGGTGVFPENPPIDDGTYGGLTVRLRGSAGMRWSVAADGIVGEGRSTGRVYGEVRPSWDAGGNRGATLRLKSGIATAPTLRQSGFRLGGLNTVRGFDYGFRAGQAVWAAQLDVAPTGGRLRPVLFVDAGQAGEPSDLLDSRMLIGAGAGMSLFNGLIRFDLSHPLAPDLGGGVRFDLAFQVAR